MSSCVSSTQDNKFDNYYIMFLYIPHMIKYISYLNDKIILVKQLFFSKLFCNTLNFINKNFN
jgi:hypothetical protein